MPRGGARDGAGRKRGSPNKATAERQAEVLASGVAPLEYMLGVMRSDTADRERRDDMAKAAAPYVHPKLAAVEMTGKDGKDLVPEVPSSDLEIARKLAFLLEKGAKAAE